MQITLAKLITQTFSWPITIPDPNNPGQTLPVNDATNVTCTLYAGRSQSNPDLEPGVIVPEVDGLELEFVGNGVYSAIIPDTFNPMASANYVMVIDADAPEGSPPETFHFHWEEPTQVIVNS